LGQTGRGVIYNWGGEKWNERVNAALIGKKAWEGGKGIFRAKSREKKRKLHVSQADAQIPRGRALLLPVKQKTIEGGKIAIASVVFHH